MQPACFQNGIEAVAARLRPGAAAGERRHDDRFAVPLLFRLTPLGPGREPACQEAILVVGRDVSRRGLSFFHDEPLAYRRAIVTLEHPELGAVSAEIDIHWCRFRQPGRYESGGRLVRWIGTACPPASIQAGPAACNQTAAATSDRNL
jgi:hypothetical protein